MREAEIKDDLEKNAKNRKSRFYLVVEEKRKSTRGEGRREQRAKKEAAQKHLFPLTLRSAGLMFPFFGESNNMPGSALLHAKPSIEAQQTAPDYGTAGGKNKTQKCEGKMKD